MSTYHKAMTRNELRQNPEPLADCDDESQFIEATVRDRWMFGPFYVVIILLFLAPIPLAAPVGGFFYVIAVWLFANVFIDRRSPPRYSRKYRIRWLTYFLALDIASYGFPLWLVRLGVAYCF